MKTLLTTIKFSLSISFFFATTGIIVGQNIVQDFSFEGQLAPTFGAPWTLMPPQPGNLSQVGSNSLFAHTGNKYAALGGTNPDGSVTMGTLSQTLVTTPGTSYTLSFFLAKDSIDPRNFPLNGFSVLFGGALVYSTVSPPFPGNSTYIQPGMFTVFAAGSSTLLEFRYFDEDDRFRLDDVSVIARAVPESGPTFLLCLVTFTALCLVHRGTRRPPRTSSVS